MGNELDIEKLITDVFDQLKFVFNKDIEKLSISDINSYVRYITISRSSVYGITNAVIDNKRVKNTTADILNHNLRKLRGLMLDRGIEEIHK